MIRVEHQSTRSNEKKIFNKKHLLTNIVTNLSLVIVSGLLLFFAFCLGFMIVKII